MFFSNSSNSLFFLLQAHTHTRQHAAVHAPSRGRQVLANLRVISHAAPDPGL